MRSASTNALFDVIFLAFIDPSQCFWTISSNKVLSLFLIYLSNPICLEKCLALRSRPVNINYM